MKQKLLSFILLLGLVIAGCEEGATETSSVSPFISGSKGIVAEFQDMGIRNTETGINEIFEGETFPIEVVLKNKGEYEVAATEATVSLMGISLADFDNIDADGIIESTALIEKISEFNEEGGQITLDFTIGAEDAKYNLPLTGSSYTIDLFASVVYNYETDVAVPKVCYKGDPNDPSVCEVEEVKDVFSSAAPIQIQAAEEKRAGTGLIAVILDVENVGSGKVAKSGGTFDSRYDEFSFEVAASDAANWDCKSGGKVNEGRFDSSGKATVRCLLKTAITATDVYTKPLVMTFKYKYKDIIQDSVLIQSS
jgi:hypothetical protein|tara:strand:+ start:5478 stop:6404 length:927 start_codon:yes stop_codon:yes gene_type:complete